MIVIIGKDKDFTHTLAEQIVRELRVPCECIEQAGETLASLPATAIVTTDKMTHPSIPVLQLILPVRVREVLADLSRLLATAEPETLSLGKLVFSPRGKTLKTDSGKKSADLTDKEAQLLQTIAQAGGRGVAKETLLKAVWGFEEALNTHTLETHIYRLRAKCKELSGSDMIEISDGRYKIA